jgi:hypothetical protein
MNKLLLYIVFLNIIFCECSRSNEKYLLDNESLENFSKNWMNIGPELVKLELTNKDVSLYNIRELSLNGNLNYMKNPLLVSFCNTYSRYKLNTVFSNLTKKLDYSMP